MAQLAEKSEKLEKREASDPNATVVTDTLGGHNENDLPDLLTSRSLAARRDIAADLEVYKALPRTQQRERVEQKWAEVAYMLVDRVQRFGKNAGAKEFGRLCQITTSAAIAKDKVFHKETEVVRQGNVVFNLFGHLGAEALRRITQPDIPTIDVEVSDVKEVPIASQPEPDAERVSHP